MDFESRYRVFEDMTVIEIMIEVMQGFHGILNGYLDFQSYMSFQYLEKMDDFKKIPYCVQYGESSFVLPASPDVAIRHLVRLRP